MSVIFPASGNPLGAGTHAVTIQKCGEYYVGAGDAGVVTAITTPDGTSIDVSAGAQRVLLPKGDLTVELTGSTDIIVQKSNF